MYSGMRSCPVVVVALALAGCDFLSMNYIPTQEQIAKWFPALLVEPTNIKGIYGNQDVDSSVFSYETTAQGPLKHISASLQTEGWKQQSGEGSERSFERLRAPKPGGMPFHSLEIARVFQIGRKVCVRYLQLDSITGTFDRAKDVESRWATNTLWPKYESCKNT